MWSVALILGKDIFLEQLYLYFVLLKEHGLLTQMQKYNSNVLAIKSMNTGAKNFNID